VIVRHAPIAALSLLLLASLLVACDKHDEDDTSTSAAPTTDETPAASEAKPVDHLAPGELLEGQEKSFGIVLPREARVDHAFKDTAYVTVDAPVKSVVGYVRTHVRDGTFTTSAMRSTFEHVHAPGQPGREMRVEIAFASPSSSTMVIRDTTPPIVQPYPDEESRFKAAGMQKNGKPADPAHFE
jgi:hypothetical protein